MYFRRFFSRNAVTNISKFSSRGLSSHPSSGYRCVAITTTSISSSFTHGPKSPTFHKPLCKFVHTFQQTNLDNAESENNAAMNEFLSRIVWIMRKKLSEAYPDCDKNTIDGKLVIIVRKVVSEMGKGGLQQMVGAAASTPSDNFSEDLWRTVCEVSNQVFTDMEKEKKKEKMKSFLQPEDVKEMYRFAGEVGVLGDVIRELSFKSAREKREELEFYQRLESLTKKRI